MSKYIAIDIGNSRPKFCDDTKYEFAHKYEQGWASNFAILIANIIEKDTKIGVSSVADHYCDELMPKLAKYNCYPARELLEKQNLIDFSQVEGMGEDRKLGLIGASIICKAPLITIDMGTAITINVLNENKVALGGLIMPGIYTQGRALNKFTSKLPYIAVHQSDLVIGNNTSSAINSGLLHLTGGGVVHAIKTITNEVFDGKMPSIISNGGYINLFDALFENEGIKYKTITNLPSFGLINLLRVFT